MSIQNLLNNQALAKLPQITSLIANADFFEANQMRCRALKDISNSKIAIDDMTDAQLKEFENEIIDTFNHFNWI